MKLLNLKKKKKGFFLVSLVLGTFFFHRAWTFCRVIPIYIVHVAAWKCDSYIVVGVEHAGNVLRQISVQNSLDVIAHVDYKKVQRAFLIMIILQHWVLTLTAVNVAGKETAAIEWFGNTRLANKVPGCSSYHHSFFFRLFFLILSSPESWCCKLNRNGHAGPAKVFWVEREVSPVLTVSQVEVIGRAGRPQPHGVHGVVHVSRDGRVVRHCQHHLQQWEKWGKTGLGVKDDPANWRAQFTIVGKRTEEIPSKHSVLDLARFTKQACLRGPMLCKVCFKKCFSVSNLVVYDLQSNFAALLVLSLSKLDSFTEYFVHFRSFRDLM